MKHIIKSATRVGSAILAAILLVWLGFFELTYMLSVKYVKQNELNVPRNRREDRYFFAPELLNVGDKKTIRDLTDYYRKLGYTESNTAAPGTYSLQKNVFHFYSSLKPQFTDVTINIVSGRVSRLEVDAQSASTVLLQPAEILSYPKFVIPEAIEESLPVRQVLLAPEAIPELLRHAITSAEDKRFFGTENLPPHHDKRFLIDLKPRICMQRRSLRIDTALTRLFSLRNYII